MPITDPPRFQGMNHWSFPYLHPCRYCLEDFNGKELRRRHRNDNTGVCKSPMQMREMGWWLDDHGRWRQRHGHAKP